MFSEVMIFSKVMHKFFPQFPVFLQMTFFFKDFRSPYFSYIFPNFELKAKACYIHIGTCYECEQVMAMCMVSVLISVLVMSGLCIKYPNSNKIHPRPPINDTSWLDPTYPNCTNYTATYTGLSLDTLRGNIYRMYGLIVSINQLITVT